MSRIAREKNTVELMIGLYCRGHHHLQTSQQESANGLCPECQQLLEYAHKRLDHCKFGEGKTTCEKCTVHCYKPEMRENIRQVMRYSGPRMMWHHPIIAIRHLFSRRKPKTI